MAIKSAVDGARSVMPEFVGLEEGEEKNNVGVGDVGGVGSGGGGGIGTGTRMLRGICFMRGHRIEASSKSVL
jgi:hypothetical protein